MTISRAIEVILEGNITEYYLDGDYPDTPEFLAKQASYTQELINLIIEICKDFKYLDQVIMFITVIFGVITNILCIIVFARPNFKKTTMGVYYINISFWNIIFLLFYMLVVDSYNVYDINVSLLSDALCKITVYFQRVIAEVPPWIEVYLTIDRYLAVCHPQKLKKIRNRKYITPICCATFVFLCLLGVENFWYYINPHVKPSHEGVSTVQLGYVPYVNVSKNYYIKKCTTKEYIALSCDVISVMFRVALPSLLMCIFSYLIVKTVLESKKKMARKASVKSAEKDTSAKKSRESTFTNTVIYMNIIFIVLNIPVTIMVVVIHIYHRDYDLLTNAIIGNVYLITFDIANLYYGMRFVFNLIFNKLFQDEFFLMFKLKKTSDFSSKTSKTKGVVSTVRGRVSTRGAVSTIQ